MRKDGADIRVSSVVIGAIVAAALAYVLPVYGYRDATARTEALRARYDEKVRQMYSPVRPVHYNPGVGAVEASQLEEQFAISTLNVKSRIARAEDETRMLFPAWTIVPKEDQRDPLVYFAQVLARKKYEIHERWKWESNVELPSQVFNSKKYWIW